VEFKLTSEDVIHAFWIPALGGKVDMIPGRQTRLKLLPLKTGEFRGVCAEYCGEAHTQMAFTVKVVSREEFDLWLAAQREPARTRDAVQAAGLELFLSRGCGACHAIRGTAASGVVGPDLTHVGSRSSIGAGWLPNDIDNFRYWLRETKSIKPGVEMPQFDFLSEAELQLLAEFMEGLQ
jgi:cytochrome c oxidase subunit 2